MEGGTEAFTRLVLLLLTVMVTSSPWSTTAVGERGDTPTSESLPDPTQGLDYIGKFEITSHLVQGHVYYDSKTRTLLVRRFYYDGKGPDAMQFLFVPNGEYNYSNGFPLDIVGSGSSGFKFSKGINRIKGEILSEDLTLQLPPDVDVNDLDRLVFWCLKYGVSFGRVDVSESGGEYQRPKQPDFLVGRFVDTLHDVSGTVYVVDNLTLEVRDFSFDGRGPSVYFLGAEEDDLDEGVIIPFPYVRNIGIFGPPKLTRMRKRDITLMLPSGKLDAYKMKWLWVWCDLYDVSFGHVLFP